MSVNFRSASYCPRYGRSQPLSHSRSFDHRLRARAPLTAIASAFRCPTSTTSPLPRVTPAYTCYRCHLRPPLLRSRPISEVNIVDTQLARSDLPGEAERRRADVVGGSLSMKLLATQRDAYVEPQRFRPQDGEPRLRVAD